MGWAQTLVAGIVAALLFPATATAAPTWLPPTTVSAPGDENQPAAITLGPDGTAIVAFQRATCAQNGEKEECKDGRVMYSVRPPGGSFSPPAAMPGDPGIPNLPDGPGIAFDDAGNAVAVWDSRTGTTGRVRYSIRPPAGEFGSVQTIESPEGGFDRFAEVAVAPDGRAVVTYVRSTEGKSEVWYATRPPGGAFATPKPMVDDPGAGNINDRPMARMDDAGSAIVSWVSAGAVRYAVLPAGAADFSSTRTIEQGGSTELAMAPSGAAVMVWSPPGVVEVVRYAFRAPGGAFGTPLSIPEPDDPLAPRVAIAPDGSAVAAWTALVSPDSFVRWAAAPPGGPFGPPLPMTGAPNPASLQELVGGDPGGVLALWLDFTSKPFAPRLHASLRPPGGIFEAPVTLPSPPQGADQFSAEASFDPQGNAAAVWNPLDPATPGPHDLPLLAAGLDAAGPLVTLDAPARVRQDRPAKFSLSATDVWSPVASTRIEFGDRKGAPGPTARHRYRPGLFTVVGSATDALGNSSGVERRLRVVNTRPLVSGLRVLPKQFAIAAAGPSASRRSGASIRFRLSERARLRFAVKQPRQGAGSSKRGGRRLRTVGTVVFASRRPGKNRVRFSGRIKGEALPPGKYLLVAVAIDTTKKRSRPRKASFRILGAAG